MIHLVLDDDAQELAASYVLGALEPSEAEAFERHLAECGLCREEVARIEPTAGDLALAAPAVKPPATLETRVFDGIAATREVTVLREEGAVWTPTPFEGVDSRTLFVDPAADRQTILIRMTPGAIFPTHVHADVEECLVLSGDLIDGDLRMRDGDYSRYRGGTDHGPLTTEEGCVLLVMSSLHNEIHQPA